MDLPWTWLRKFETKSHLGTFKFTILTSFKAEMITSIILHKSISTFKLWYNIHKLHKTSTKQTIAKIGMHLNGTWDLGVVILAFKHSEKWCTPRVIAHYKGPLLCIIVYIFLGGALLNFNNVIITWRIFIICLILW
jgi:hypothetical protein